MQFAMQLFLCFVTGLALVAPPSLAAEGTPIRVTVSNITKPGGVLLAGAYDRESTWLSATTVARTDLPVPPNLQGGTLTFEMHLPPGRYAISVFQDMNGNRKLDSNFLGIPTEDSGSSNNAPARFSAPKFRDAAFDVGDQSFELAIRLN